MAGKARYQVIELYDVAEPSLPRFVAAQRQGESAWRITWEQRDKLPGKLAAWFAKLAVDGREPAERIVLGRGVGLPEQAAFALAKFRIGEINRMATGDPEQMADFLMIEPAENVGRRGRPVTTVQPDGTVKTFPSVAAAARIEGVARETVSRRVRRMLPKRNGRCVL